jgi:hypothetical protein
LLRVGFDVGYNDGTGLRAGVVLEDEMKVAAGDDLKVGCASKIKDQTIALAKANSLAFTFWGEYNLA